tara:strand:+ start:34 stop:369 length:336 start_codon:yes stop_codon:yes gene_type:complete
MSSEDSEIEYVNTGITLFMQEGEMFIDIHLPDYEDKTLKEFAQVIASLSSPSLQIEAINMMQNGFKELGKEKECDKVLIEIASITIKETDLLEKIRVKQEEEPCIKPSDML